MLSETHLTCVAAGCFHITISKFRIVRNAPVPKAFATLDTPLSRKRRVAPSFLAPPHGGAGRSPALGALRGQETFGAAHVFLMYLFTCSFHDFPTLCGQTGSESPDRLSP
ncbi:conserved hypothetical protein [Thiomonas sp. CB2]|nr:conserved hypothetical protein [Thiomonas sp. CB2]CQR42060.1 conserved hypothetical protein [Thiomonas sp. CB3]VDY19077.1 conserved protein of unknown function [Thiomonas sp. CB2]